MPTHHKENYQSRLRSFGYNRIIGIVLSAMQLILSLLCIILLLNLSVLPTSIFMSIVAGLFILWLAPFTNQILIKTRGIVGKVIITLLLIFLGTALCFLWQGSNVIRNISGPGFTTNQIVVAVRDSDPAQTLHDVIDSAFGVQFTINAGTTHDAIVYINEYLDKQITTLEFDSLFEQFTALQSQEVDVIIYHSSLYEIMADAIPGIGAGARILYSFDIVQMFDIAQMIEIVHTTGADHILGIDAISDEPPAEEVFAVLITGIDTKGAVSNVGRSDTNILLVVNPNTLQVLMINTPRDFLVPFPSITGNRRDKLAHAGIYGPAASVEAISLLYGINISYYLRTNMTSFVNIIDALGGVELYSPYAFTTVHGGTQVRRGQNNFSGNEALNFVRERSNVPGGDETRGDNAMILISAIMSRAMSPAFITGAPALLSSLGNDFDTNMPADKIQDLIRFQLSGASWEVITMSATGRFDRQVTFSIPGLSVFVIEPSPDSIAEIRGQIAIIQQNLPLNHNTAMQGS